MSNKNAFERLLSYLEKQKNKYVDKPIIENNTTNRLNDKKIIRANTNIKKVDSPYVNLIEPDEKEFNKSIDKKNKNSPIFLL